MTLIPRIEKIRYEYVDPIITDKRRFSLVIFAIQNIIDLKWTAFLTTLCTVYLI